MHNYQVHVLRSVSGRERVGNDGMVLDSGYERPGSRMEEFRLESGYVWLTMAMVFGVTSFYGVIDEGNSTRRGEQRIEQESAPNAR